MDRFVGILRTEDALTARVVRQNFAVDFTDCKAVAQVFSENTANRYELVDCPLMHLPTALFPQRDLLLEAWDALRDRVTPDMDAVRRVLTATVLRLPASSTLPSEEQAQGVKPTAAHPRAYAGTKYKPPKSKSLAAQDWRVPLCDPRRLGALASDAGMEAAELRLPQGFRISLYLLVRGQRESEIAEVLALYWSMSLDKDAERLAAAAYFFRLQPSPNACAWCRLIVTQAPEYWTPLLHLLIASGADTADLQKLSASFGSILAEAVAGNDPFYRAYWLFAGIADQTDPRHEIDPEYLLAGYRLADTLEKPYHFHEVRRSGYFPKQAVLDWGEYCRDADRFYVETLLHLWKECGVRPGLGECLEQANYTALTPNAACRWLLLLTSSWDNWGDLPEAEAEVKWKAARPLMGAMFALVQSVPSEHQEKCVWHLIEYLWQWNTPAELQADLPSAFALTRRLCRPPFAEKNDPTLVTMDFLAHLPEVLRDRFLQAPDASFKRLEQACRRDNEATLIGRGTWALTRHQPEFSVRCFEADPERLFHAAKLLGTLSPPMRDDVVKAFAAPDDDTLRAALMRLEQAAMQALAQGFSPEAPGKTDKHALQVQQVIQDNRQALRKFLAAYWEGRTQYRQEHPLTRQWLAGHPNLDLELWQSGITTQVEVETLGAVTLTVEQDPLEALKLGTYVGSCLGLGGSFAYSAAAVVLDINKQVVYARDKRGTVRGRQLVAVSEANHLVCYEVYPLSAQKNLGPVFAEFDRQFASALGLPIYCRDETEKYEIAHILSHDWWDDYAWDLTVDTEET